MFFATLVQRYKDTSTISMVQNFPDLNIKGFKDRNKHVYWRCSVILSEEKLKKIDVSWYAGGLRSKNGMESCFQSFWPQVFSDFWIIPINDIDSKSIIGF